MHRFLFAQETSLRRCGARAQLQYNKTGRDSRGRQHSSRPTAADVCVPGRSPQVSCPALASLPHPGGCQFSSQGPGFRRNPRLDPHPWSSAPALMEQCSSSRLPARWFAFSYPKPCHIPAGQVSRGPHLRGPRFSLKQLPKALASFCKPSALQHLPRPRKDCARTPRSPGTHTWPQRVRTGWCNTSRHTEQSKEVRGSSGSPLRSRAREVAEEGADLPVSLLSTEPIAAPLAPAASKSSVPAAGCLLSCGGGRKSRPSCDRRLPARTVSTAQKQPLLLRPTSV